MDSLSAGRKLDNRFTLLHRLRRERGELWLAEDRELGEAVWARVVPRDLSPRFLEVLERECRKARELDHPALIRIRELHRRDGLALVTMDPVEGTEAGRSGRAPVKEAVRRLLPVAEALDRAHLRGIVHGNLLPDDVIFDASGEPRLLELGIAGALAGRLGSVSEDLSAFGAVLFQLLTGEAHREGAPLPASVPDRLRDMLEALLGPDPGRRPRSMEEILQELHLLARSPGLPPLSVGPPPRLREVRPVYPRLESTPGPAAPGARAWGLATLAAFVFLIGTAVAVFVALPRWVEERKSKTAAAPLEPEQAQVAPAEPAEPRDLEDLAARKTRAEQSMEEARRLRDALEARGASSWGGAEYRDATGRFEAGERKMSAREYGGAASDFDSAAAGFASVETRGQALLEEALERGNEALASGSSGAASSHFQRALQISPQHREAALGLERSRTLDEVLRLVAEGEASERRGEIERARELYRKGLSLDPRSPAAAKALARADAEAAERAFGSAIAEGMAALTREDFPAARESFERAKALRPGAPEPAEALAQVAEGLRNRTITEHRDRALGLESREDWRTAEKEYDAALALDPSLRFALEGKQRAAARALLADKLDFQIARPDRLSDENALREAALLLEEARGVEQPGPAHAGRIDKLQALVSSFSKPVEVQLVSDALTEITVYRVGRLGRFDRRSLELRPGRYTVHGSREGYRDVRRELVVEAGKPLEPIVVRCEERVQS